MADELVIEISFAWWWKLYVFGINAFCIMFNTEPDLDKLQYWTCKAIRTKCNGKRTKATK